MDLLLRLVKEEHACGPLAAGTQSEAVPGQGTAKRGRAVGTPRAASQRQCLDCWLPVAVLLMGLSSWVLGAQVRRCSTPKVGWWLRREGEGLNACLAAPMSPVQIFVYHLGRRQRRAAP